MCEARFGGMLRQRTKVCRHCGRTFTTLFPAQRTCKRPECVEWSEARRAKQIFEANKRQRAKRRRMKYEQTMNKGAPHG